VGFGEDDMGITQIKEWYNRFRDGRTSVEGDIRSGRPSTSRNDELIDQARTLGMQDRRVTVRELAVGGISTGSVHSILTDNLALQRVSAKFVHKLIQTFLAKHNIPVVRQTPFSPDMAPCDYWLCRCLGNNVWLGTTQLIPGTTKLIPHLKTQLKKTRFESRDDIFTENNNATRAAYTFSLARWRYATDAVCRREKIYVWARRYPPPC
jgi:hypothetical protein